MSTFIVAEVGVNHNGSLDIAKRLIDAAKWAGADAVKLQKRTVEVVYANQLETPRESPFGTTLGEQKRALEFSRLQWDLLASYCIAIKMPLFASAWDIASLEFLAKYAFPYNKIASAMATNHDFVVAIAAERKPTFVSTGMCEFRDIHNAITWLRGAGVGGAPRTTADGITLMHCIGTYPADDEELNLCLIPKMQRAFGLPVGYSGHEAGVTPSVVAVVLGACAIERHITLDRSMYGSDQAASLEPVGFKRMVEMIRKLPVIVGKATTREISDRERAVAKKLRYWENSE
jgi:N-acetylneuraminate synthase